MTVYQSLAMAGKGAARSAIQPAVDVLFKHPRFGTPVRPKAGKAQPGTQRTEGANTAEAQRIEELVVERFQQMQQRRRVREQNPTAADQFGADMPISVKKGRRGGLAVEHISAAQAFEEKMALARQGHDLRTANQRQPQQQAQPEVGISGRLSNDVVRRPLK